MTTNLQNSNTSAPIAASGLTADHYQQVRSMYPGLPATMAAFADWFGTAASGDVAALLVSVADQMAQGGPYYASLSSFRNEMLALTESRQHCHSIVLRSAGEATPDDCVRPVEPSPLPCSVRGARRRALPEHLQSQTAVKGFSEHVRRERELASRIDTHAVRLPRRVLRVNREPGNMRPPGSSVGHVRLESEALFSNAAPLLAAGKQSSPTTTPTLSQCEPVSYDPLEWSDQPDFNIGFKWLGRTSIPPRDMSRHWLIFGETGSGKTRSAVIPLLSALIRYGC